MNKMLTSGDLILALKKSLITSGFSVESIYQCDGDLKTFHKLEISFNNDKMTLFINVRNIGSAYIPKKPYIKRRQVGKLLLEKIPPNTKNSLSMLIGIIRVDNIFVYACWNPFYFIGHSTNRSCYVLDSSIEYALQNGVYDGEDCKTPVLVFTEPNFNNIINIYLNRSVVD